jgi:hypothetical protein
VALELPGRGEKIVACLATGTSLIEQGLRSQPGLRLAESAAYNLREALDAVVAGRPAAAGGLPAVITAWDRYQTEVEQPDADVEASRSSLDEVLNRVAQDQDRSSWHARKLLEYLRHQTGVEPLPGELDPIAEYAGLRKEANAAVHGDYTLAEVALLLDRTVPWFVRMFTPPDAQVRALTDLAAQPYERLSQIEELRRLATNAHHLRLFFSKLADPTWLKPLYEAHLIQLPSQGEPWPVTSLLGGLGQTRPQPVAGLLSRLLKDTKAIEKNLRLGTRFELLRTASQLGLAGYPIVAQIAALHGTERWASAISMSVANSADPMDSIVTRVADAVLGNDRRMDGGRQPIVLLEHLESGLSLENAAERITLVAAKVRRLVNAESMKYVALDITALTAELDQEHEAVVVLTHHLLRLAARARELGVPTPQLRDWINNIHGEIGERITCQLLSGAADVPLRDKINHIALRLGSSTATGDDRDLINNVLASNPTLDQLEVWAVTFGDPSPAPEDAEGGRSIPDDWARAWRWSLVLPPNTLTGWSEQIAYVTAHHGEPSAMALETRPDRAWISSGRSPHGAEALAALPPLAAAALIASWRPDESSGWNLVSARELARTLETVVKADPTGWAEDPTSIVTTLREPVYVLHYFQALTEQAGELSERAPAILDAARLVRLTRWEPTPIGSDDYDFEPRWDGVDTAIVDLVAALANKQGQLSSNLDDAWGWALEPTTDVSVDDDLNDPLGEGDALNSAVNRPWGRALEGVLALAAWEFRNLGKIRPAFEETLDRLVSVPGSVGMEYRAILASKRPLLEGIARSWLDSHAGLLFSSDAVGRATFDLTLKWSRPTSWFLGKFRTELVAAARRGAAHATAWMLVGASQDEPGYGLADILNGLRGDIEALRTTAAEMALLVQDADPDSPALSAAVSYWRAMLDADRQVVPVAVLDALGRWVFVTSVDEAVWMELMHRTLELTEGLIDYPIEVADRCKAAPPSELILAALLLLLGRGEPWERDYVEGAALDALRLAASQPVDYNSTPLRTRLIELGRHEAADIAPGRPADES